MPAVAELPSKSILPLSAYVSTPEGLVDATKTSLWAVATNAGECLIKDCHKPINVGDTFLFIQKGFGYCYACVTKGVFQECSAKHYVPKLESAMPSATVIKAMAASADCYLCHQPFCKVCNVCETADCGGVGERVSSRIDVFKKSVQVPRSQKAKGYKVLERLAQDDGLAVPMPSYLIQQADDAACVAELAPPKTIFARPCPVRIGEAGRAARHGFVESRTVEYGNTREAGLLTAFHEAREADPDAEVLVIPYVSASLNAVITPTRIAVGEGHDGATGGRATVELPLLGVPFGELKPEVLAEAGIGANDDAYVEAVLNSYNTWQFTQLRAGPKIPRAIERDFVPFLTKVERIVHASGDLLTWEKQVESFAGSTGVVVVCLGGSITSHYGVHGMTHKIPVMTSRVPTVGEWLQPTTEIRPPAPEAVIRGLGLGIKALMDDDSYYLTYGVSPSQAVRLLLVAAHNAHAMSNGSGVWLGMAATFMLRLGMAAAHGEARYALESTSGMGRDRLYDASFRDFFGFREKLGVPLWAFGRLKWSGGFGGEKWAACTKATVELDDACLKLLKAPSAEAINALIDALNRAVNQAHNNGWWLNKFTGDSAAFDAAAQQSLVAVADAGAVAYKLKGLMEEDVAELVARWQEAEPIQEQSAPWFEGHVSGEIGAASKPKAKSAYVAEDDPNESAEEAPEFEPLPGCECEQCQAAYAKAGTFVIDSLTAAADQMFQSKYNQVIEAANEGSTPPVKVYASSKKLPKLPSAEGYNVVKAHVRYHTDIKPSDKVALHFQLLLEPEHEAWKGLGYVSRTYLVSGIDKAALKAKLEGVQTEASYSSDAGGYLAAATDTGVYTAVVTTEPHLAATFKKDSLALENLWIDHDPVLFEDYAI